jgi:hypothetical protein
LCRFETAAAATTAAAAAAALQQAGRLNMKSPARNATTGEHFFVQSQHFGGSKKVLGTC